MSQATSQEKSSQIIDAMLGELEREAKTTLRVLERVPDDKLSWKPHEKSMSLGQLALHIANTPAGVSRMVLQDSYELNPAAFREQPSPASRAEVIAAFQQGLSQARENLQRFDDASAMSTWTLTSSGKQIMAAPKAAFLRNVLLNHSYHHRGQLSVYLRLLNIPVPSIYGPSADENPFAG
ncbi:MAG: DinB family protein [Acidimicrobiia bacterium]|nr:DinB family protein [Acidimicrobiia bacterium]